MYNLIKKRLFKKSILLIWLVSYLAVLSIPLFSGLTAMNKYRKEFENELYRKNQALADTICGNIINAINSADSIYMEAISSSYYDNMVREKNITAFYQKYGVDFFEQIDLTSSNKNEIELCFFYSGAENMVISSVGCYEADFFYKTYFSNDELSYEDWKTNLTDKDAKRIYSIDRKNENKLWYNIPMRDLKLRNTKIVLSFLINTETFFENASSLVDNSRIQISDFHNNVLYQYGSNDREFSDFFVTEEVVVNSNRFFVKIEFPTEKANASLKKIKETIIINTILTLIVGLLCIFYILKKSYAPIKSLLGQIDPTSNSGGNELERIEKYLKNTQYANKVLNELVEKNDKDKRQLTLQKALFTSLNEKEIQDIEILKDGDRFILVVFNMQHPETYHLSYLSDVEASLTEKYAEISFVVSNLASDIFDRTSFELFPVGLEDSALFLLKVNSVGEESMEKMGEAIEFITEFINSNFGGGVFAIPSSVYSAIREISFAYSEIVDLITRRVMIAEDDTILKDDCKKTELNFNVGFNLYEYIQNKNYLGAKEEIELIFSDIKSRKDLSSEELKIILSHLAITVVNLLKNSCEEVSNIILQDIVALSSNVKHTERFVLQCFEIAENKKIDQYKNGIKNMFVNKIISFIDANYTDTNLNINSIGRQFEMSPSYLSRLFKEEYGKAITDIINLKRIEKAKMYLSTAQYRIEDVASKVGFGSVRTFNRVFKTIVGISPKDYAGKK